MTRPTDQPDVDATTPETIDAAARYIAGRLAFDRMLEATDPHGWDLARRLASLADTLTPDGDTAAWVETALPRPQPHPPDPLIDLFLKGRDTAPR
jgi:hypothetical protein